MFYPREFTTDTTKEYKYFYNNFWESEYVENYGTDISYRIFRGSDPLSGKGYSIIIANYKNKIFTLPFDIEEGSGLKMLNESFTELYKSISGNGYYSKKQIAALIFDRILRNNIDFERLTTPNLFIDYLNQNFFNKNELSQEQKSSRAKKLREYKDYTHSIKDSLFIFMGNNRIYIPNPSGKYIIYLDESGQVFVMSIDDEKVEFKFFNPFDVFHIYI